MASPAAAGERRPWSIALGLIGAIYLLLYPLPFALEALRAHNLLRLSVGALFAAVALAVASWALRRRLGWRAWAVLAGAAAVYAGLVSRMDVLQERLHLIEYGAVALALRAAAAASIAARRPAARAPRAAAIAVALCATVAAGWLDEGIQALLPNRYYDIRDVGFNALAGALALAVEAALERSRAARSDFR